MHAEWSRHLLAVYAALAFSMMLSLYLWLSSRIEQQRHAKHDRGAHRELESELAAARSEVESLRADLAGFEAAVEELREATGALVAPTPSRSGLNLSSRSQVLRRHRFGEQPAAIARSLGLPRAEVELLLKVNRIVIESL